MMRNNKNLPKNPNEKLEKAKRIASKNAEARNYDTFDNLLAYSFRAIASFLNKIFFSTKFAKLFALIFAIILYIVVNESTGSAISVTQSATLEGIPVKTIYNSEIYEISGVPEDVRVIVQGDMSDITLQKSQSNSYVSLDLSGLIEGTYSLKLVPNNFNSNLVVNVLDTPTVNVNIKKKVTSKFNISYEFINANSMEGKYILSEPTFDTTEVLIRASQDTIDSISFVKALIDVTGVTESFSEEARIVAYNNNGQIVDCDIFPSSVNVNVAVSTPSKEVPIIVRPVGTLMEGKAIDSISLDYSTTTIYASMNILNAIDAIYVDVDVTSLTKDSVDLSTALTLPAGAKSMTVTKINMHVTMGEKVSKDIAGVSTSWVNNDKNFKFSLVDPADATMTVTVSGTQNNIDKIKAADIKVALDLANVSEFGQQQVPVVISGPNEYLITYTTSKKNVGVNITE